MFLTSFKIFLLKILQVLITILFMWGLCAILTATNAVGPESAVRTDLKLSVIQKSAWFRFPYPCRSISNK